jgi:hypothetical protein
MNVHEDLKNIKTSIHIDFLICFQFILTQISKETIFNYLYENIYLNHFLNNLFKNINKKLLVLKLPNITPSGFNIGMIFTIVFYKNELIYSLSSLSFFNMPDKT